MPRQKRVDYAGAVYHPPSRASAGQDGATSVMARRNQARIICADDGDGKMGLATCREACR